jgi:hypothetical protein
LLKLQKDFTVWLNSLLTQLLMAWRKFLTNSIPAFRRFSTGLRALISFVFGQAFEKMGKLKQTCAPGLSNLAAQGVKRLRLRCQIATTYSQILGNETCRGEPSFRVSFRDTASVGLTFSETN